MGTGLGGLVKEIQVEHTLEYKDIPHFPVSTVESHKGRLIFGSLGGKRVVAMQGRFHFYEGYTMPEVVFPVRVMKLLGIKKLFVSNACGSLVPKIKAGSLMILKDHINMLPNNPLTGHNEEELGPRFPDMSEPYDNEMILKAESIAKKNEIKVFKGTYVAVPGPNLETPAEYNFLRIIGGHVVGMSTVPEVLAARHMNIPVFAISVVTDEGWHHKLTPLTLDDVIAVATRTEPKMTLLLRELISSI